MPKYQVLQPIEKNNVMYVAKGSSTAKLLPSACHGKLIPVDASGEIELSEEEAGILIYGQVPLFQGKPDPIGGAKSGKRRPRKMRRRQPPKPQPRRRSTKSSWRSEPRRQRRERRANSSQLTVDSSL